MTFEASTLWLLKRLTGIQVHWLYELRADATGNGNSHGGSTDVGYHQFRDVVAFDGLPEDQAQVIAGHTGRSPRRLLREGGRIHAMEMGGRIVSQLNVQFGAFDVSTPIPLRFSLPDDAFFVSFLYTPDAERGHGYAQALLRHACGALFREGYGRAYCHIRSTNIASRRAFRRAGWRPVGIIVATMSGRLVATPGTRRRGFGVTRLKPAAEPSGSGP
ncbi:MULTISPECIES: GNAT family N-acetyltransferase [unclassified Thioalkalivibrio]|uniref:GNAT family N-acetyltransferase n=1 Tax=unclassified Thioalkalivibrio TaxID=2621013 RepID=UPI00036B223B|nr:MULTISPECIES: GNAT family N-acetyltransferase [unclassified Thioalkalivibrio]